MFQDWAQAGWTWGEVCNLPNSLSLARLASGPFISALIINHNWSTAFVAISVAAITDWLDGAVAKRWHTNSVLGSYLDPLADKVLVCCVVGALGYEVCFVELATRPRNGGLCTFCRASQKNLLTSLIG